jgi:hypothetical protein
MLSIQEFRSMEQFAGLRGEINSFLHSDAGMYALRLLRDRGRPNDVSGADALASVKTLSHLSGYNMAIDDLETLAQPLLVGPPVESTFEAPETDHQKLPNEPR